MKITRYNIKYFIDNNGFLTFGILIIGNLISTLSTNNGINLWQRFLLILFNKYNILILLFLVNTTVNRLIININKNYNYLIRTKSLKLMIKETTKQIHSIILFNYAIYIILSLAGAWLFCYGNIKTINFSDTNIIFYIIYSLVKIYIIILTTNIFYCLLTLHIKKHLVALISVLLNLTIIFIPNQEFIMHFYNIVPIYTFYLTLVPYVSFKLEILCFALYSSIAISINNILYTFIITLKKKDVSNEY